MDRQTGIGMKSDVNFKNRTVRIVRSRNRLSNDRRTENRTDRRKQSIKYRYLMVRYLSNKKIIFKIGLLEHVLEKRGTDGRTDKSTKYRYLMSYLSNKKRILKIGRLELV